jgi:hypothetical protein
MMQRCYNERVWNYSKYGGRGIRVCVRWHSPVNFITDMGRRPSSRHSIERRNNNRGYSPDNCYWATRRVQAQNKRSNRRIRIAGITRIVVEWARYLDVPAKRIYMRLYCGWPPVAAVLLPMSQRLRRPSRDAATLRTAVELLRQNKIEELRIRDTIGWRVLRVGNRPLTAKQKQFLRRANRTGSLTAPSRDGGAVAGWYHTARALVRRGIVTLRHRTARLTKSGHAQLVESKG